MPSLGGRVVAFLSEAGVAFLRRSGTNWFKKHVDGYTDAQVTQAFDTVTNINNCAPPSTDLDQKLINSICKSLKKQQGAQASPWCITTLKTAATMICTCGPDIVREATFNLLGCD